MVVGEMGVACWRNKDALIFPFLRSDTLWCMFLLLAAACSSAFQMKAED